MPPKSFKYVIVGGGVAAGYAAWEFVESGLKPGELAIISKEAVAPYERPALSKGYMNPEGAARLPGFHTCVNVGGAAHRHGPEWYVEKGIELMLKTEVTGGDLMKKELMTKKGDVINFETLILAMGSGSMRLTDFKVPNADAKGIYYLREEADAALLDKAIKKAKGKNGVVVGGGYIGMEVAAALAVNGLYTTVVFKEPNFVRRLFTPQIASAYQTHYEAKSVKFIKVPAVGFIANSALEVTGVRLKDGSAVPADIVVIGVGARANTSLFQRQLTMEKGGYKVDGRLQTSLSDVYAAGDVATFPVKLYGNEMRREEHVKHARLSGKYVVQSIRAKEQGRDIEDYDYLPYFYSKMMDMNWQFFGLNAGECIVWGLEAMTPKGGKFGAYWVKDGRVVGGFLESGTPEEYEKLAKLARLRPPVSDPSHLAVDGLRFLTTAVTAVAQ